MPYISYLITNIFLHALCNKIKVEKCILCKKKNVSPLIFPKETFGNK